MFIHMYMYITYIPSISHVCNIMYLYIYTQIYTFYARESSDLNLPVPPLPRHIIAPNLPVATISSPKTSRQLETKAS